MPGSTQALSKEDLPLSTTISEQIPNSDWLAGRLETATAVLASLSACTIFLSIAVAQIFLGACLLTLLLSRKLLRFPTRLGFALLAFLGWSLLSLAFSPDIWESLPQARKLFVFLALVVAFNAYERQGQIRRTVQAVVLAGAASALYGLVQFARDYRQITSEGLPFYENYILHQITGFMSHWLTFGGQLLIVFLLAASAAIFGKLSGAMRWAAWIAAGLAALALLGAFTRGIWLGTAAGLAYLLIRFKPRSLWLLPTAALLLYALSPAWLQQRGLSILNTSTDSSNQSRVVMLWTGLNMIADNPWLGVGPQRTFTEFLHYKPAGMPLPTAWYGHLHNNYLQLAAERGIPCLLFWLWVLFEVFVLSLTLARSPSSEGRALGHAAVAITIGLMVAGLFEFNLGDSEIMMPYLFLIAAGFAWTRLGSAEHRPAEHRPEDSAPGPAAP